MGLFGLFKKRDEPAANVEPVRQDPRLAIAHDLVDEAREYAPEIVALDESLLPLHGNAVREYEPDEREAGKTRKYPRALFFHLYEVVGMECPTHGVHGTIYYLADGTPGKAVLDSWHNHVHHHIQARIIDGVLRVSFIDRNVLPDTSKVRVYDYRKEAR